MNCFHVMGLSLLAAFTFGSPTYADWTEDFSGGTFHQPWIFFDDGGSAPPDASVVDAGGSNLLIGGDASRLPVFDSFAVGLVGVDNPAFKFTDLQHRATVSTFDNFNFAGGVGPGNNDNFIMIRNQGPPNFVESYLLALDFNSGEVDLVRIDAGPNIVELGAGASSNVPGFNPASTYTLELSATGTTITGNVYDGPNLVSTVSAVDATYSMGWSGLGAAINDDDDIGGAGGPGRTLLAVQFDDVSSQSSRVRTPGDIDEDGDVDRTDAAQFNEHFGATGAVWETGDFNGDHLTNLDDLKLLQINLGPGAGSPIGPVPEPSTFCLALLTAFGLAIAARRRLSSRS